MTRKCCAVKTPVDLQASINWRQSWFVNVPKHQQLNAWFCLYLSISIKFSLKVGLFLTLLASKSNSFYTPRLTLHDLILSQQLPFRFWPHLNVFPSNYFHVDLIFTCTIYTWKYWDFSLLSSCFMPNNTSLCKPITLILLILYVQPLIFPSKLQTDVFSLFYLL